MNKQSKLELKVDSTQSSQTNLLNSSTNSTNSQLSRPSRIPKYNRDHHSSTNSTNETSKKKHYSSSTKIPQRKPTTPPQTLNKNPKSPLTNNESQKVINSKTFDKTPQSLITECKEVKLFMNNKNLVDILLVPKEVKNIRTKDDEGYSTMSSEIMHRTQNTSNRTSTTNPETISTNSVETSSSNNNNNNNFTKNCKKRYCFPTLKTFNYYSNNRYYHQYHKNKSSLNSCCKYLSDTDIQSLCNQLNSYDKDLFYNVFHLDTLYNNVDYILFNSYASDTELEYNYNRRYGRYNEVLDSNYQLYINDYFNQGYADDDEDEVEEEMDEEKSQVSQQQQQQENELMDYELKEEYQFEIDYSNPNMVELSVDETDGFVFDDEDVNFVLDSKICLNEYKNMFEESKLNEDLIFSSQSMSSSLRTSTSSSDESSSEYPSSSDGLSIDSINPKNNYVLNHDYFMDSIDNYDEYELCDGNRLLIEETDENLMIDNFDLDDFVNQLNKQCKADKMLISSENNSKKLQELAIKEATRIARNSSTSPEYSETSKRPVGTSLVRRHTITTMPISAACLVEKTSVNEINRKIKTPGCQTPCDSPSKYIDTKAYVGSFTTPTNSRTSTPLRRAETVYKKHTYIPPDEESTKPFQNGKSLTSVGSTPVKVKNNFNTDFYRLCSDTFYDNSENNFNNNYNESTNSIFFKLKQQLEPEHLDDLQSNATNHVSNLFDKWLINSKG
ncbi:unnamed protein product [Brachionus calyciflorus]|uniref:Uncharacterized protein n=1 Tax=Brachionus calyciflorus TaxID=104777 RepID=A0A814JIY9_9BILA|nr:unnamed protein product [Brachionus calyciflorus]